PLRLWSGILLYGYPGCGRTMLAPAVSQECGLNFISIKGPELLRKCIGASDSRNQYKSVASTAKPWALILDKFGSGSGTVKPKIDGVEVLEGVFVLAATRWHIGSWIGRPDLIDVALLRASRLDKSMLCDVPDEED
ncbi:P-loop containing nucleoside triphosphate hydrolase protein, partial [Pisolithus marmoratus]